MKIVIVDYDAGNVKSLQFALERLGVKAQITAELEEISNADKVIFPGQGEAASAMNKLRSSCSFLWQSLPHSRQGSPRFQHWHSWPW